MSAKSFVRELLREVSPKRRQLRQPQIDRLEKKHDTEFQKMQLEILPGAQALLGHLEKIGVRLAIATTSGKRQTARLLKDLKIPSYAPVVNGDEVKNAKPSPNVFVKAAERLACRSAIVS